ncbi:phospholipase [Putridiphycobacter roseus]|uniref:Phospholipase n=1 Tax=Putridiphycobacter roseus TaxID=2219161 RepID=A0A2W1N014_9FLAO|nr:phospholipase [Putridiphycobacter roseus]PZE16880.1 phospholipase [Putridiphycobacter roseus]
MEHQIQINKSAIYQTFGDPEKADTILFALHGYGQLSKFFIRKFQAMPKNYFIVAPEGFHRFYLNGTDGRVGASWMTKEKRIDDIKDYVLFLNKLWSELDQTYSFKKRVLLGFSQGGATAARWLSMGNLKADKFILWAGVFPPDMQENWDETFQHSSNIFVVGEEDPYFTPEKIKEHITFFKTKMPNFSTFTFKGPHNIDKDTLLKICT